MLKYLLVIVVVGLLVAWLLRRAPRKSEPPPPQAPSRPDEMVRCAHCGVHLPLSDAHVQGDQRYCCDAHRRSGPA